MLNAECGHIKTAKVFARRPMHTEIDTRHHIRTHTHTHARTRARARTHTHARTAMYTRLLYATDHDVAELFAEPLGGCRRPFPGEEVVC